MANTTQLTRNRTNLPSGAGRPREGAALLQGFVLCGRCGQRMSVRYQGTGGRRPVYECQRRRLHDGQGGMCWSVPATPLDAAVEAHVLAALTPANLALALEVLTQFEQAAAERDRPWQLQLERARYEAQRAERQYEAGDPDYRLVARTHARPDGRYSTRALATRLGVSIATIHYWREQGILPAIEELPGGPWWHEIPPAVLERLRTHRRRAPVQPSAFDPQHFLDKGAL